MKKQFKGKHKGYKGFVRHDGEVCIISLLYDYSRKDKNHRHARFTESCFIEGNQILRTGKYLKSVFGFTATGKPYSYKAGTYINGEQIFFYPSMYSRRKGYDLGKECAVSFANNSKIRHEIVNLIFGEIKPPLEK